MITTIDMTTGRLVYRSPSASQMHEADPRDVDATHRLALQLVSEVVEQSAAAMPPDLAQASVDVFLDRWDK